ncbi:MAG: TRAP transporter substrate-binding protein DctP [Eubacterium sp.]|nr:TRAP transporter substrate-binding protein DctP [Eubacterium sp.]
MKKRVVSVLICAAMVAALAAGCGSDPAPTGGSGEAAGGDTAKPDKVYTLQVTQHDPEASSTGEFLNNWAAEVEEKSGGAIDIIVHHGGSIAGPKDSIDAVLNGTVDIAWGLQSFYAGQFPVTEVFMLPCIDITQATVGSEAIWNFYNNYDYMDAEYANYHVLFLHTNCQSPISTVDKKIEAVSDLKGMALRGNSGPPVTFIGQLGASAEACAINDLYSNLDKGVYDGCITDWHAIESFKLYETVNYFLDENIGVSTYFMLMNPNSYANLPADPQKILDEVSADAGKYTDTWDECEARVKAMDGVAEKLYKLSDAERANLEAAAQATKDAWIAATPDGQAIYEAAMAEIEAANK